MGSQKLQGSKHPLNIVIKPYTLKCAGAGGWWLQQCLAVSEPVLFQAQVGGLMRAEGPMPCILNLSPCAGAGGWWMQRCLSRCPSEPVSAGSEKLQGSPWAPNTGAEPWSMQGQEAGGCSGV